MRLVVYIPASLPGLGPRPEREDQEQRAIPHHVTVVYSNGLVTRAGTEPDPRIVRWVMRRAVRGCAPGLLWLGGIVELGGEGEGERAVAARVYGLAVHTLRRRILDGLAAFGIECPQTHAEYIPHLTLAYVPAGEAYSGPTPAGTFAARSVRWRLDGDAFRTLLIGGKDGDPKTELTAVDVPHAVALRSWGRRNDLSSVPALSPLRDDVNLDDGWTIGKPFRIARVGEVYCRDTGESRLPRPVTRDDLAQAVEVARVHRPGLDVDHDESCPMGAVLAMALVDGGDAVAILPSYNRALAAYVGRCSGALWSSPMLCFEPYYHPATGAKVGDFWIRSVAITADPATLHDALDPVSLTTEATTTGRWVRGDAVPLAADEPGHKQPGDPSGDSAADETDEAEDPEMDEMMELLKGIQAEQAKQAAELAELRKMITGGAEGEAEEMAAEEKPEGDEKMSALTAEIAKLREANRLSERTRRIEAALNTGRMKPAQRKTWESSIDRDGGATFAEVVEAAPAWSAIPQPKGHSLATPIDLAAESGANARHDRAVALQTEAKAAGRALSYAAALAQADEG